MRTSRARFEGYKQALAKHGIPFREELVESVDLTRAGTFSAMKRLMQLPEPPTAIVTFKNSRYARRDRLPEKTSSRAGG